MNDDRIENARDSSSPDIAAAGEPPRVYYLACGAQCDVFWWARRKTTVARGPDPEQPPPESD